MGNRIGTGIPGGLLIPAKLTHDRLRPVGPASTDSSYSQQSSRPGHGVALDDLSKLIAHVHASQDEDMLIRTIRAGMPGREGVQLAYRKVSESGNSQHRGWNPPGYANGQAFIDWGFVAHDRFDAVTIPTTQEVVVFRTGQSKVIDPISRSVGAAGALLAQIGEWDYPALTMIPEGERLILQFANQIWYSDDTGSTWSTYSETPVTDDVTNFGRSRMAYFRTDIGLLVEDLATPGTVHQYASADLGASFTLVDEHAALGSSVAIEASVDGLFVFYIRDSDSSPVVRRLSSPFEDLTNTDEVVISVGSFAEGVLVADPDGTLYVILRNASTLYVLASVDAGATWTSFNGLAFDSADAADYLTNYRAVSSLGSVVLLSNWQVSTSVEEGISATWLGGWQAVTAAGGVDPSTRMGFTDNWIAIELPEDMSATWPASGVASSLVAPGELERVTVGSTSYHTRTAAGDVEQLILWQIRCDSGGAKATRQLTVNGTLADGVYDYRWAVNLDTTGYRVEDVIGGGQVGGDELMNLTSDIILLIWASRGTIRTYWWRPGESSVNVGPSGALTNDAATPAATGGIRRGHQASGTATSHETQFHWQRRPAGPLFVTLEPLNGVANIRGKPITRIPVPVPSLGVAPLAGFLSASSGPARRDDGFTVSAAYDYPITNVFPRLKPSPDSRWRSQDLSEQILTFRFEQDTWIGDSIALYIAGANFRTAALESSPDGIAWTTRGTMNLAEGFEGLGASRAGDALVPGNLTADADRYLFEEILVGGHAQLDSGAVRRIVHNSAGGWTQATTVKPVITLEDVDAGDPVAPSALKLVFPSGLLVIHLTSQLLVDWWRIRIPAQVCPDSFFEAGIIMAGKIVAFGDRIDWGRGTELIGNALVTRDEYGTSRARELGPPMDRWSMHWQAGTNHLEIRRGVDVDYVSSTIGIPLAGDEDVLYQLFGLIKQLKSGEIPCLAIEEIPDANVTLTDSTRYIYGRLLSSARGNNVAGDLGIDEQQRIESIIFDAIL